MTYIKEFRISNLAGAPGVIRHTLDRNINIFWGLNGSGKTTLLRILSAALENNSSELDSLPFDWAEVVFYSETNDVDITRRYDRKTGNKAKKKQPELDWRLLADLDLDDEMARRALRSYSSTPWPTTLSARTRDNEHVKSIAYRHRYLPISRIVEPLQKKAWSELSADERFVRHINYVWSRYSATSLAQIRDVQQQGLAEVLAILFGGKSTSDLDDPRDDDDATAPNAAYDLVSTFLHQQGLELPLGQGDFVSRYRNAPNRHVVAKIRSVMKMVDSILTPQRELQAVIDEMFIGNKHLMLGRGHSASERLSVVINKESVAVSALSSGEKQLLHILLETLAIEESTIMVDEPELSLHVDWQRGLVESMRRVNPQAQFILATHSPELMIDVDENCVFEL